MNLPESKFLTMRLLKNQRQWVTESLRLTKDGTLVIEKLTKATTKAAAKAAFDVAAWELINEPPKASRPR